MRRGLFRSMLFVAGCVPLLVRGACLGQIVFIPGPAQDVPNGPQFAAAADFDGDGIDDVAVTTSRARKVTVLFGAGDGTFRSVVDVPLGRTLRGLTTGDFNLDLKQDFAVVDAILNRVLMIFGNGDGTFTAGGSFRVARRGPQQIASGNFDDQNGPDLVTANGVSNKITTLFNLGGNRGFRSNPDVPVGRRPKDVSVADFNTDGLDDIAVLNTGATGTDELALLLNNGVGSFQAVALRRFVVGKGSKALTVADFNDDGVPDVAVLNAVALRSNVFSISVLLSDTEVRLDGVTVGTGFFTSLPLAEITCPPRFNQIPINCTPQDIKSADFDLDGFLDLAVSFSTQAALTRQVTAGFVSVFQGDGSGRFALATQLLVGLGPRQMAIGDYTGDGTPDIAVTERGANTVRILRDVAPPRREPPAPCRLGTQCTTNFCVNSVCCTTASCPAGTRCDIPGNAGSCALPADNGTPCDEGAQCASGFCVDGFCCGSAACAAGEFCNTGECAPPAANGSPCTDGAQCASFFCVDGFCCEVAACPAGLFCNIPGTEGFCAAPAPPGTACTEGRQCDTGNCVDRVCCVSPECPAGEICAVPGFEGQCMPRPTATRTPTRTTTPSPTPTPQPDGAFCDDNVQCTSLHCVVDPTGVGVCCDSASCPSGQFCSISGFRGTCHAKVPNSGRCEVSFDCESNNCVSGTCQPAPTPTPKGPGTPCSNTAECRFDLVCNIDESVCCSSLTCPAGQSCRVPGAAGICTALPTPIPTPTPLLENGLPCLDAADCASGFCTDGTCCETDLCPADEHCDIFGFAGQCHPPLPVDEECATNTDCEFGLVCAFDPTVNTFVCSLPPTPTPTLIPFTPPPTSVPPEVTVSRGGGCSLDGGSHGTAVWILGVLPFALWRRRRRRARAGR